MIKTEIGSRLPNALMLELFLRAHARGAPDVVELNVRHGVRELESFAARFRGGQDYPLLRTEQFDPDKVRATMARWYGRDIPIEFVSRAKLLEDTATVADWNGVASGAGASTDREYVELLARARVSHRRLLALLDLATRRSLRIWLPEHKPNHMQDLRTADGRDLENLVSMALGSRVLLDALDVGFGNAFAHVFKDDIVRYWVCYFGHVLHGAADQMERLEPLGTQMRTAFPVAMTEEGQRHPLTDEIEREPRWILMTD